MKEIFYEAFKNLKSNSFSVIGIDEPMYEEPLMGVAAGDDPYFDFLKEHIGDFHWSPAEAFELKYGEKIEGSSLRVVSMVFPQTDNTKKAQKEATVFPCDRWLVSRGEWEKMMKEYCTAVENAFEEKGVRSVSIDLRPEFSRVMSENHGIASKWSHRHAAFAAGNGTFGLTDGFISRRGLAIRLSTFIVEYPFDVTERKYSDPYEWCTMCGACIRRCPCGALDENGHIKSICADYEYEACEKYYPEHIDGTGYIFGCGLCQAGVPCTNGRPKPRKTSEK